MKRLIASLLLILILCVPAMSLSSGKSRVDPAKVRQGLAEILSAREYDHTVKMNAMDRFFARVGKAIRDAGLSVLRWLGDHLTLQGSSVGEVLATVGSWLAVAGFLVLLFFVVRKLIAAAGGRTGEVAASADVSYDIPAAKPLMKQAAKLAEAGDYRGAFRATYLACIAYLDDIRALRFERSRTNWEYLRELRSGGHEKPYAELHPLTRDFDRKIYGRESCDRQDYQSAAATYHRLSGEEAR